MADFQIFVGTVLDPTFGHWLFKNGGYSIPSELEYYFDYEAFGRDARINDGGTRWYLY